MSARAFRFVPLALAMASAISIAHATTPARSRRASWLSDATPAANHADARGVVLLEAPRAPRVRIAAGSFVMGSTDQATKRAVALCMTEVFRSACQDFGGFFRAEQPAHAVSISSFDLDRTEVTVEDYGRCVAAGACAPPGFPPDDPRFDRPRFPVTEVRWDDAATYCEWAGGRLPTEAEWEFAARGGTDRDFPWGNVYNPHLANHGALAPDATDATDGFLGVAPVGSFPDGRTKTGIDDMAGNVSEWVSDFFDLTIADQYGYPSADQSNPRGPATGAFHVIRGGSYVKGAMWMRTAARITMLEQRSPNVGFRCAADAK